MALRSALARLGTRGHEPAGLLLRRDASYWAASTAAASHAPLLETSTNSTGFSADEYVPPQAPGSRIGAPVLPGGLHGWAADAWVAQDSQPSDSYLVPAPTGTSPIFTPSFLEVDDEIFARLHQPLDLEALLPQTVEELDIPDAQIMPGAEDGLGGDEGMQCFHQTYNPGNRIRKRRHGFLERMTNRGGRRVVKRRKARGRWKISA